MLRAAHRAHRTVGGHPSCHVASAAKKSSRQCRKAAAAATTAAGAAEALPLMKMKLGLPQAEADKMMTPTMAHIMRIISQHGAAPSQFRSQPIPRTPLSLPYHCTQNPSPRVPLDRTSLTLTVMFGCGLQGAPAPPGLPHLPQSSVCAAVRCNCNNFACHKPQIEFRAPFLPTTTSANNSSTLFVSKAENWVYYALQKLKLFLELKYWLLIITISVDKHRVHISQSVQM